MPTTLDDLRRFAVARSLFRPTTLKRALERMGFVQADPIRAPARAQDLILRHRVNNYRAGDLERLYTKLGVEEDFFINYGFVTRTLQTLMHPRANGFVAAQSGLPLIGGRKRAQVILEFVRERGVVHPREVETHFAHGSVQNYWGGSSNATTRLLDAMHYQGWLRVVRREAGIRLYAAHQHEIGTGDVEARLDALVDAVVYIYAPLPARSLPVVLRRLQFAVPQLERKIPRAILRAKERLAHGSVEGIEWYWPAREDPARSPLQDGVRLLAPFDPVVWDRARFERLWGWTYRFEAYTPVAKRKRGYYALPLLWKDRVIGWGNLSVVNGELKSDIGYVAATPPRDRFRLALEEELERIRMFLKLKS